MGHTAEDHRSGQPGKCAHLRWPSAGKAGRSMSQPTREGISSRSAGVPVDGGTMALHRLTPQAIKAIGARVRTMRLQAGWTQAELGRPYTKGYISQVESGRIVPSLSLLAVIAARLGTTIERLVPELEQRTLPSDVGRLLDAAARLQRHGEAEGALRMLEQATRLAAGLADSRLHGQALLRYAEALRRAGRAGDALAATGRAFEVYTREGPLRQIGQCYHLAARAHGDRGDLERARTCFEQALRHIPRRDVGHSVALNSLGRLLLRAGLVPEAAHRARQAIALSHMHGDGGEEARAHLLLAEALRDEGRAEEALEELTQARAIVLGLGDRRLTLSLRALEAVVRQHEPNGEARIVACLEDAEAAQEHEICVTLCSALFERRLAMGDDAETARIAGIGVEHAEQGRDLQRLALLHARQALAYALLGQTEAAAAALVRSRETYSSLHRPDALLAAMREIRSHLKAGPPPLLVPLLETPPSR